jgi:formylglycine-generating enzyme required for sulfatase activity
VKVTDLGLAKAVSGEGDSSEPSMLTQTQAAMGTPYYMSPEQFMSARDVGPAADVWSLGVTLYHLVTGRVPWTDTSVFALAVKVQTQPMPDARTLCTGLSDGVCTVITKALQKDSGARYADCGEMAKALREHLTTLTSSGSTEVTLADANAGSTKMALVVQTPPPMRTLTLIASAQLAAHDRRDSQRAMARLAEPSPVVSPSATPATMDMPGGRPAGDARRSRAGFVLATLGLLVAAGAGVGGWLLYSARNEAASRDRAAWAKAKTEAAASAAAWDHEAAIGAVDRFLSGMETDACRREAQAERAKLVSERALSVEDEKAWVAAKASAETKAGTGDFAGAVADVDGFLASAKTERFRPDALAMKQSLEAKLKTDEAFRAAIAAAEKAAAAGDLAGAIRELEAALGIREDAAVRARLEQTKRLAEFRRLVVEGDAHAKAAKWGDAKAAFEKALALAPASEKRGVADRLAAVTARFRAEEAVASAERERAAGRMRAAYDVVEAAKKSGLTDARLDAIAREAVKALAAPKALTGPLGVELVLVPGGRFMMGSDSGALTEKPVHEVTVSPFYVGRYEVTQAEYEAYSQRLTSVPRATSEAARRPAVSVSWQEAVGFCDYLTRQDGGGAKYRLPTEAEWEIAARGTEGRMYPWGNTAPGSKRANLDGTADGFPGLSPVGSFPEGSTPDGLADMAGNAAEWCADRFWRYPPAPQTDPVELAEGTLRVIRGGSFVHGADAARATARMGRAPANPGDFIGFRVVRELTAEERLFLAKAAEGGST